MLRAEQLFCPQHNVYHHYVKKHAIMITIIPLKIRESYIKIREIYLSKSEKQRMNGHCEHLPQKEYFVSQPYCRTAAAPTVARHQTNRCQFLCACDVCVIDLINILLPCCLQFEAGAPPLTTQCAVHQEFLLRLSNVVHPTHVLTPQHTTWKLTFVIP